jgi:hypothetical protein
LDQPRFAICQLHLFYEGIVKTTLRYTAIAGGAQLWKRLNELVISLPSFPGFKNIPNGVCKANTKGKVPLFTLFLVFSYQTSFHVGKSKDKVQLCPLTGGQMRWFVQCAVVLFVCIPNIDERLLLIWKTIAELDVELDKDHYSEEDLNHLRTTIASVFMFIYLSFLLVFYLHFIFIL